MGVGTVIETTQDLIQVVNSIDPAQVDYEGWLNVGMALKSAGAPVSAWDAGAPVIAPATSSKS